MPANDYVRARINPAIKNEAAVVLSGLGLTVSDACRMMLTKIASEKRLPFGTDASGLLPVAGVGDSGAKPLAGKEEPNTLTRRTLEAIDRGKGLHRAKDAADLFRQLGI